MENSLTSSIEFFEMPEYSKEQITPNDFRDNFGLLRIPLTDVIPAQALYEIVSVLDNVYLGDLWLSQAESARENRPFPNSYEINEDDTLYISQLQIGTPNFIEFFGQAENLIAVLGIVSGMVILGVLTVTIRGIVKMRVKNGNRIRDIV